MSMAMLLNAATVVSASERGVNSGRIPIHALLSSNTEPFETESPQTHIDYNLDPSPSSPTSSTPSMNVYNQQHINNAISPQFHHHHLPTLQCNPSKETDHFTYDSGFIQQKQVTQDIQITNNSSISPWDGCNSDHSSGSESNQVINSNRSNPPSRSAPRRRWKPHEDALLMYVVRQHGPGRWNRLAEQFPGRNGRQVRLRWVNHLQPSLDKREWRQEEDDILLQAHATLGNRWALIAMKLSGRTDNSVKNRFKSLARRAFREAKTTTRAL